MECERVLQYLLETGVGFDARIRNDIQDHLATCSLCQGRLSQLVAEAEREPCYVYELLAPIYVQAQLDGENVQEKYSHIWWHLQSCPNDCPQIYRELYMLLQQEQTKQLVEPAVIPVMKLPFVANVQSKKPAWVMGQVQMLQGFLQTVIQINRQYLEDVLMPERLVGVTRAGQGVETAISRQIPIITQALNEQANTTLHMVVTKEPVAGQTPQWQVQVWVLGPLVPSGHVVRLLYGIESKTAVLDSQGQARFTAVSPHWLIGGTQDLILQINPPLEQPD